VSIGTLLSWCKCTTSKIVLLEITRTLAVLSLEPATVGLMTAEGGGKVDLAGVAGPGEAAAVLVELCLRFTCVATWRLRLRTPAAGSTAAAPPRLQHVALRAVRACSVHANRDVAPTSAPIP